MSPSTEVFLSLKDVTFSYDASRPVLDGVSLDVSRGERILILGHNGSGKSTLVRISGALQSPLQGACFVCGVDVSGSMPHELRRKIGMVFQDPDSQIVASVVEDEVAFGPENHGVPSHEIEKRVELALSQVGLSHKRTSLVAALSGGEKQRLALAGALASNAECLILDEPTAMLDPEGRLEVADVLRSLHKSGTTIIQVTHQLESLDDADRVLVLSKGKLVWQGVPEEFKLVAEGLGFKTSRALPLNPQGAWPLDPLAETKDRALLEVNGLSFRFDPNTQLERWALNDVSASFPEACWTSILGRTGSGKSTLVQHLNGLYKIEKGSITMNGQPIPQKGKALRELRRAVGLVFQKPEDQIFCPTVEEELSFAPGNAGFPKEKLQLHVRQALSSVGLAEDFLPRNPINLSGGEKRLVAIASVLAADPQCLILDEPTAGLDSYYREKILELLNKLKKDGKTVITITHDFDMAFEYSDHLLFLDDGKSLKEGDLKEIYPFIREFFPLFMA